MAEAIARNLTEMASLGTLIIVIVTGEGGSGGALGIGVGDVIMMLSNAVYSVILRKVAPPFYGAMAARRRKQPKP